MYVHLLYVSGVCSSAFQPAAPVSDHQLDMVEHADALELASLFLGDNKDKIKYKARVIIKVTKRTLRAFQKLH